MRRGYRHHLTHIKSTSRQNSCYHYERIGKRCWLGAWLHRRVFGLIYNWNIKSRNSKNINIFFYLNYDWMFYINILARRNRKQNTLKKIILGTYYDVIFIADEFHKSNSFAVLTYFGKMSASFSISSWMIPNSVIWKIIYRQSETIGIWWVIFFLNIITCDFELNLIKIILSYEYKIEYLVKQLEYDVKLIELTFLFFSVPFIPRA